MTKETYYFSHDYGSRNDPKLVKVLMRLGQEGKGVYWDLVEMLYEQGGYLMLSDCDSYAFALRTSEQCIASLINDFGLFENDGEKFWSNSVLNRLDKREAKSLKAKQSALKRWNKADSNANASKNYANALPSQSDPNALKERKGKESKVKDSIYIPTESGDFEKEVVKFLPKVPWEQYSVLDFETPKTDLLNDLEFISKTSSSHNLTKIQTEEWVKKFFIHIEKSNEGHANLQAHRKHCTNWINLKIQNEKNNKDGKTTFKAGQRTNGQVPTRGYSKL
ncbi:Lin1244/Lin1753 domain-containing protein [Sphingobacterium anhuiense]|uniref:Lin1244/Lin1753 domain-containing protein n=1 Tax=Sphingobacterium anhuiense TaxID=493780 RepID=UPI003C2C503A